VQNARMNLHQTPTIHNWFHSCISRVVISVKKVKVAHTRLPSVGFRSWSRFLAVSLQLRPQPLRGLLPILLLCEQKHDGCEQFAQDCYPTASRFEPGPFCTWVQHANHAFGYPATKTSAYFTYFTVWTVRERRRNSYIGYNSFISPSYTVDK